MSKYYLYENECSLRLIPVTIALSRGISSILERKHVPSVDTSDMRQALADACPGHAESFEEQLSAFAREHGLNYEFCNHGQRIRFGR
jgi:hypothetical protein